MTFADSAYVAGALVTVFALGDAVMRFAAPRTAFYWFERMGFAYVLGTGIASILWMMFAPAYALVSPVTVISVAAWATVAMAWSIRPPAQRSAVAMSRWSMVLATLLGFELVALTSATFANGLGFDGVFNFELKARLAFENQTRGQLPLAYFSDASRVWSHPGYPLHLPFAEFWIYAWLGRIDQFLVKCLFPLYYIALVSGLGGAIRRAAGVQAALAAVVALGLLPAITVIPGAASGYAEIPLAAAFAAAVCCTLIGETTSDGDAFWLAGMFSAVAAWTKAEGVLLAMCVGVAAIAVAGRRAWPLLVVPLVVVVPWGIFQRYCGLQEADFPTVSPFVAMANLDRLAIVVPLVARELITPGHWGLLWPLFAMLAAAALIERRWDPAHVIMSAVVVIPLCAYPAVYLLSSWSDVDAHVRTSFSRLLVPVAPIAMMFATIRIGAILHPTPFSEL